MKDSQESKPMSTLTNARRDLYLLLSGFLREAYDKPDMLSGGPFRLQDFRDIAEGLFKLAIDDPETSDANKQIASKHYERCLELYEQHMNRPQESLPDYSMERKIIDEIATNLLTARTT